MKSRNQLVANAMKKGMWWEITIPGLEDKIRTPRLGKVEELARKHAAEAREGDPEIPQITVDYQLPPELATIAQEWEAAEDAAERAAAAQAEAARRRKDVVEDLRAAGYTTREIEKVLGISFQRVLQILNS